MSNKLNWTNEERLKLIKLLASRSLNGPRGETHRQLMERIIFLCDMPANFLEVNKGDYQDVMG